MKSPVFAVTGGIACGKSTMARFLAEAGCLVLDTDEVVHRLQGPGGAAVAPLTERFGKEVVADDGSIDRAALARIVFADAAALKSLEALVHPLVDREVGRWLAADGGGRPKAVLVPLLFEAGYDKKFKWDAVVAVVCPTEEQMRRLKGRGLNDSEARARILAQMPCDEKRRLADFTVENGGTVAELREETLKVLRSVNSRVNGE